jgi:predicted dehydrogenase
MKRRNFIEKGAIATSGLIAVPSYLASGKVLGANETLNVGVIGTGDRGTGLMSLFKEIPDADVIACCDILPFRLENGLSYANSRARGYTEYGKLLENKDVDAVIVSTPFSMHSQMALDALDAGKHVYCEKTMVKGIEETKELVAKVQSSDRTFQVGHQWHSSRLYKHVVKLIGEGQIGEIASIKCQWNRNADWRRPVPDPKWERMVNWRMYKEYSGGLVAELCSHQMDIVNWILNDKPEMVTGFGGIDFWKDGRETYDNVHITCQYPQGIKASFTCLTTNGLGDYEIKILGKKGTITLDYTEAWFYPEDKKDRETGIMDGVSGATVKWNEEKGYPIQVDHIDPTLQALVDFKDSIKNNTKPISNEHTGAQASIMVQMALDAMENNRVEKWETNYNL